MKISSSLENRKTTPEQSFKGIPRNPKYLPNIIGKIGKAAGEYISMPEQKLFLAATALTFQPLIDLKFADEEKKKDAAIKSASKAIAGGLTGVTIRAAFLKMTERFIGYNKHNKLNKYFFPAKAAEMFQDKSNTALANIRIQQYQKTLGTLFAILFMILVTNSKLDVPITSDLQDLISGIVKENKSWPKSLSDVLKNRGNKIKNKISKIKNTFVDIKNKTNKVIKVLTSTDNDTAEKKESNK